jgi:DNA-binding response OmpR family regulator
MGHALRAVVADKERAPRELAAGWLAELGHQVEVVGDGRALIQACRATAPDLLISDAGMPDLDALADRPDRMALVLMSGVWEADRVRRAERLAAVRVSKPLRPLELVAAVNASTARPPTRVLVADSDEDTGLSLGWLLGLYGCRVRIARDETTAEADAERFHPHLILVDPDRGGRFDVVRRIRDRGCGAKTRIAAHTGWTGDEAKARARAAGCDDYLVKPVDPAELRRLIDAVSPSRG